MDVDQNERRGNGFERGFELAMLRPQFVLAISDRGDHARHGIGQQPDLVTALNRLDHGRLPMGDAGGRVGEPAQCQSRSTTSGAASRTAARASWPLLTTRTVKPARFKASRATN